MIYQTISPVRWHVRLMVQSIAFNRLLVFHSEKISWCRTTHSLLAFSFPPPTPMNKALPPPKSRAPPLPWHTSSQMASRPSGAWTQCLSRAFLQDSAVAATLLDFEHMAYFPPSFFLVGMPLQYLVCLVLNSIIFQVKKWILRRNTTVCASYSLFWQKAWTVSPVSWFGRLSDLAVDSTDC